MSSIITDYQVLNKLLEYESIFKHYGIETQSEKNDMNDDLRKDKKNLFERIRNVLERNENNKKKKINAKTITKKSKKATLKNSSTKSKHSKKLEQKVCSKD
jgi:hypothetical protein